MTTPAPKTPRSLHTEAMIPLVYDDLRVMARRYLNRERIDHTLQATALVHEAYLRLSAQRSQRWPSRAAFFFASSAMLRRILINYALSRKCHRRGGNLMRVPLESAEEGFLENPQDLLELDELMNRLSHFDARAAGIAELKIFGGLSTPKIARLIGLSPRTVDGDWAHARAWLQRELEEPCDSRSFS